jgi:hypothetical protein
VAPDGEENQALTFKVASLRAQDMVCVKEAEIDRKKRVAEGLTTQLAIYDNEIIALQIRVRDSADPVVRATCIERIEQLRRAKDFCSRPSRRPSIDNDQSPQRPHQRPPPRPATDPIRRPVHVRISRLLRLGRSKETERSKRAQVNGSIVIRRLSPPWSPNL